MNELFMWLQTNFFGGMSEIRSWWENGLFVIISTGLCCFIDLWMLYKQAKKNHEEELSSEDKKQWKDIFIYKHIERSYWAELPT